MLGARFTPSKASDFPAVSQEGIAGRAISELFQVPWNDGWMGKPWENGGLMGKP